MLDRDRRERDESIGTCGTERGEPAVLRVHDASGQIAIGAVPPRIDAQYLDVDALLVHALETLVAHHQRPRRRCRGRPLERRAAHDVHHVRNEDVGVHVHRLHASAPDADLTTAGGGLKGRQAGTGLHHHRRAGQMRR